jgi:putative effector of murein hydrolase
MLPDQTPASLAMAGLTLGAYAASYCFARRVHHPLLNPVLLSAGLIILVLLACGKRFEEYAPVRDVLTAPLGAATAALAIPVYNQRARLRAAAAPLLAGVLGGTLSTIALVVGIAVLGHLDSPVVHALAVKSVTTAIAVELAKLQGGDTSLTAVLVIATGVTGAIIGPSLLNRLRVVDPVARGVAIGTTSHAIGTAAALLEGEASGAMSSLAMVGAASVTATLAPSYVTFLLRVFGYAS